MKKIICLLLTLILTIGFLSSCMYDHNRISDNGTESEFLNNAQENSSLNTEDTENTENTDSSVTESPVANFEYEINEKGTITITKYIGTEDSVVIPHKIDNIIVERIGRLAFFENSLSSVVMPDSIASILDAAFQKCKNLEYVKFSSNLKVIGPIAFNECTSLKTVDLSYDTMTKIYENAFSYCDNLETVVLGNNITSIDREAFIYCTALKEINLPNNLESLGMYAFAECRSLESINIPKTLKSWGMCAFAAALSLKYVTIEDGLECFGSYYTFSGTQIESLVIPKSVINLAYCNFSSYDKLKEITFEGDAPLYIENKPFGTPEHDIYIYYDPSTSGWDTTSLRDIYILLPIE